jgi:hypothetical protein
MQLNASQVERFYGIWLPLMLFVNRRLQLVQEMLPPDFSGPYDVSEVRKLRDALWADDSLREAFIAENPAQLSPADLRMVASWEHRVEGGFYALRHLKKYTLFLEQKSKTVYGVLGLASPLDEVIPFVPCYLNAVLLPFEKQIIYDSLIVPYNVHIGPGIRRDLEQSYRDARERGAIVTSLLPSDHAASDEEQRKDARAVNARVLEAFRPYLYRANLSTKVAERDLATATAFAEACLLHPDGARSLRDFDTADLRGYVSYVQGAPASGKGQPRAVVTGLTRLIKFLRDTERMDYDSAEYALDLLKGKV